MSVSTVANIETQHNELIHDAQLDYYSRKLATIYDVNGDVTTKTAVLTGHEGPVWQVSWAHPRFGVILASCSYDGSVIIHQESSPAQWIALFSHRLHDSSVNAVSWAPHEFGLLLACASSDGKISLLKHMEDDSWSTSSFQDCRMGCNAISWAPYGSIHGQDVSGKELLRLATASCDHKVKIWKCPAPGVGEVLGQGECQWQEETKLETVHTDWVLDVAWAPATGMPFNTVASCGNDTAVYIWTQREGDDTSWRVEEMHRFSNPVWHISWSVTGNILAVSHGEDEVSLWKQNLKGKWEMITELPKSDE